jgi:hypothetical protein
MDLIYFILTCYGLTQIILYGSIFDKLRPSKDWLSGTGKLFHCPMCLGFWTAVFLFCINKHTELFTYDYSFINAFLLGCLGSGTSYLISTLINDFGLKVVYKREEK